MSDAYELSAEPRRPILPGSVVMREDQEELLDAMAADLLVQSGTCIAAFGDFHLAIAYSPLVHALIVKLMVDPKYRSIEWTRTHLWTADERRVPPGHTDHSMTHLEEMLVEPSGLPREQVHPMHAHHPQGCELYESELREYLGWREKGQDRIDLVVMEGSTPLIQGVDDPADRLVAASEDDSSIVMARRLIRASRMIAIGMSGRSSRDTVKVLESGELVPGIEPVGGTLRWYLDHDACREGDS